MHPAAAKMAPREERNGAQVGAERGDETSAASIAMVRERCDDASTVRVPVIAGPAEASPGQDSSPPGNYSSNSMV